MRSVQPSRRSRVVQERHPIKLDPSRTPSSVRQARSTTRRYEELKDARARRDAAAQVLRACTANCGGLERALAEAESAVQVATRRADASARAVAQIGEAIHGFSRAHGTFTTALDNHVSRATGSTSQLSSQLQQYLGSMGEGNRPGSHERSSVPPGSSSNSRGSVANVALSQIDDDRSEALTFDKVPRDQVVSGLDRLKSVVEPAVAMGKGSEYFSSRDTSAGLSGDQSYSGVHRWFYDSDQHNQIDSNGVRKIRSYEWLPPPGRRPCYGHRQPPGDRPMSIVGPEEMAFERALADLDAGLQSTEAWRDDQRTRLERSQLIPLRAAANTFLQALRSLDKSLDAARRLLAE